MSSPCLPQLEKARTQQRRPNAAKNEWMNEWMNEFMWKKRSYSLLIGGNIKKKKKRKNRYFLGHPVVKQDSKLPLHGARVRFLVGEQIPHAVWRSQNIKQNKTKKTPGRIAGHFTPAKCKMLEISSNTTSLQYVCWLYWILSTEVVDFCAFVLF